MALLKEGEQIRETYEVERFLGEGAFAEVYRVNHRFLGRQAMKVFKQTNLSVEEVTKMLGEAILLSRIGHPNIVRVFTPTRWKLNMAHRASSRWNMCRGYVRQVLALVWYETCPGCDMC